MDAKQRGQDLFSAVIIGFFTFVFLAGVYLLGKANSSSVGCVLAVGGLVGALLALSLATLIVLPQSHFEAQL